METKRKSCWIVTGASSGLGAAISMSALQAGHFVLAAARNPPKAAEDYPEMEQLGGKWIQLDVAKDDAGATLQDQLQTLRIEQVDVLVNNAGSHILGSVEDLDEAEMQAIMNVNFWGAVCVTKALIARLRQQESGATIVNMSSMSAMASSPGNSCYNASKAALEAWSECLRDEVGPLGVRVLLLEPGLFATRYINNINLPAAGVSDCYESVRMMHQLFSYMGSTAHAVPGDPAKLGRRVVEFVDGWGADPGLKDVKRLPLGKDVIVGIRRRIKELKDNLDAVEHIALTTDSDDLDEDKSKVYTSLFQEA